MEAQTVGALVIAAVAGTWLVRRFRRRGFDDDAHGCSGCHGEQAGPSKTTGLSPGATPSERPEGEVPESDALRRP